MKFFIIIIMLSVALFSGGDILPVEPISKFEKMENDFISNYVEERDVENSFNPTIIDNCVTTCGEPAEILAYYGEDIPNATTELCFAEDSISTTDFN